MKPPVEGKRTQVSLRVPPALKRRIDAEAFRQGRAVADEVEARLEASFARQDLLTETMGLAYGEQVAALLQVIGEALNLLSSAPLLEASAHRDGSPMSRANWLRDPDVYAHAKTTIITIVETLEPPDPDAAAGFPPPPEKFLRVSAHTAAYFLHLVAVSDEPRWAALRDRLGGLTPALSSKGTDK